MVEAEGFLGAGVAPLIKEPSCLGVERGLHPRACTLLWLPEPRDVPGLRVTDVREDDPLKKILDYRYKYEKMGHGIASSKQFLVRTG